MLKQLIKKLLGFLAVAIGGKDYSVLQGVSEPAEGAVLPVINGVVIGKDVKSVKDISIPGGASVKIIYGRPVYVPASRTEEDGVIVRTTDLTKVRYCTYTIDYDDIEYRKTHRNNLRYDINLLDEPLSEETHNALVALHEYRLEEDKKQAAQGNPIGFERRLIRLYPPHPKEAAATPQATTDHPHP